MWSNLISHNTCMCSTSQVATFPHFRWVMLLYLFVLCVSFDMFHLLLDTVSQSINSLEFILSTCHVLGHSMAKPHTPNTFVWMHLMIVLAWCQLLNTIPDFLRGWDCTWKYAHNTKFSPCCAAESSTTSRVVCTFHPPYRLSASFSLCGSFQCVMGFMIWLLEEDFGTLLWNASQCFTSGYHTHARLAWLQRHQVADITL